MSKVSEYKPVTDEEVEKLVVNFNDGKVTDELRYSIGVLLSTITAQKEDYEKMVNLKNLEEADKVKALEEIEGLRKDIRKSLGITRELLGDKDKEIKKVKDENVSVSLITLKIQIEERQTKANLTRLLEGVENKIEKCTLCNNGIVIIKDYGTLNIVIRTREVPCIHCGDLKQIAEEIKG